MAEIGGKSAAIAAARSAAQSYQAETTEDGAPEALALLAAVLLQIQQAEAAEAAESGEGAKPPKAPKPQKLPASLDPDAAPLTPRQKVVKQLKTLLIAVSVVIIVLGTLQTAMDFFLAPPRLRRNPSPPKTARPTLRRRRLPPPRRHVHPAADADARRRSRPASEPSTTGSRSTAPSMFDPDDRAVGHPATAAGEPDTHRFDQSQAVPAPATTSRPRSQRAAGLVRPGAARGCR